MARPEKNRQVLTPPSFNNFKPSGLRLTDIQPVLLTLDEYEALRLADYDRLEHSEAAKKMNISQPTFHRLVLSARKKIADAIINGKAIKIEGGNFKTHKN